ncbi:MAG: glycosyltransferase family 4 protein [Anaerolineae bacterium]|nr:glycosyltransferase family 4 protein [Anaerolineae bacterium]
MKIGLFLTQVGRHEDDWTIPVYQDLLRAWEQQHSVRVFPLHYPPESAAYELYGAYVFPLGLSGDPLPAEALPELAQSVFAEVKRHHHTLPFDAFMPIAPTSAAIWRPRIGEALGGAQPWVSLAEADLVGLQEIRFGWQLDPEAATLVTEVLSNATLLIAPSRYAADLTHYHLRLAKLNSHNRVYVVPFGVDVTHFHLPEVDQRPREFIHVGPLVPVKRQDILLKLIARIPGAQLDLVGEGVLREPLEVLAERLNIADRVVFHGHVPYEKLPAFYQEASFFLLTSQHEMFGLEALQALACGTDVYGSQVGILPEIGHTAPFGSVDGLLTQLLARPRMHSERNRMRRHWLATQHYTAQHMAQGILNVLRLARAEAL